MIESVVPNTGEGLRKPNLKSHHTCESGLPSRTLNVNNVLEHCVNCFKTGELRTWAGSGIPQIPLISLDLSISRPQGLVRRT